MSLHDLVLPLVRCLDAENAHALTIRALRCGLGPRVRAQPDPRLAVEAFGLTFKSPVGLAAGFDKDADVVPGAFGMGFGFVEVGSITPLPQSGNPKPRLFRLSPDQAVINRMGFNNKGASAAAARLHELRRRSLPGPLGVNFGKNKTSEDAAADYAACSAALSKYADYITINVSSPNTPGLRALQSPDHLRDLVTAVRKAADPADCVPPILVKIAPDLADADLENIAEVAMDSGVGGLIVSNTTIARPDNLRSAHAGETGGLSGRPLFQPSTAVLRRVYALTGGKVPLIGVGGIASAEDAYAKIRAGATLVQLYSALVFEGPGLVARITRDLPQLLARDGFARIADAVGADSR
ncbi:MAG: quinone-dependent dihydroorotate dehydrogenase [Alphaproteobacteria bacterium]|nr:quinone-dependent dihydroorotate dehydrogenase [Alphaproteobacteria bacterium]